jgi:hypothetical protein
MILGTIIKSDSLVSYLCQVYQPGDVEVVPGPADYAFGRFVKIALDSPLPSFGEVGSLAQQSGSPNGRSVVGVICNTTLSSPGLDSGGPRLSNAEQVPVFTPDYLSERSVFLTVLTLGMLETRPSADGQVHLVARMQGVPLSPGPDSLVQTMSAEDIRAFHCGSPAGVTLELGYLAHLRVSGTPFFAAIAFEIIRQLELLIPNGAALLSILKRNLAWQHIVEPMR